MLLAQPKPRPRKLEKADRVAELKEFDDAESVKAKRRADGRCEIDVLGVGRCTRRDVQTHHMIGGIGRRGRGASALAQHKQRTCAGCHAQITGNVYRLVKKGRLPLWSDKYEEVE